MSTALGIIGALLMLTVLVVVHEWGHMFAGRKLGFTVEEFAVGFGPKIIKWVKNGILYSIRCLPLGGFCRFYGELDDEDEFPEDTDAIKRSSKQKSEISALKDTSRSNIDKHAFNKMPAGKRAAVFAAGPVLNLIFALLITILILCAFGDGVPVVAEVYDGSAAQAGGLLAGDQIIRVDGRNVDFYLEMQLDGSEIIKGDDGKISNVVVLRDGEEISLNIGYKYDSYQGKYMMGFSYGQQRATFGFFEAIGLSFKWLYINIAAIIKAIGGILFSGRTTADLTGPVGTVALMSSIIRTGLENSLRVAAIISINLGVINLFPLPALDGGKLLLLGLEKLRGRPLSVKVESVITVISFVLLLAVAVLLTVQDIGRLAGT